MKRIILALFLVFLFAINAGAQYQFDDEFNGTSVDTSVWRLYTGWLNDGNNSIMYYQPDNITESGGFLNITSDYVNPPIDGYNYSSGYMWQNTFNFLYGTVTIHAKMPGGTGPWPAFWLLGANCQSDPSLADTYCNWPYPGSDEIDITEILQSDHTLVNQQVHTMSGNTQQNPGCKVETTDVSQDWHTYTLIWSPGSLIWEIDGTTTCTVSEYVPSTPMYLIINTAVGGSGAPTVDSSTFPQNMYVDYVQITTDSTPIFQVTPSAGANGSISPSSAVTVNPNTSATFTVTPNAGYSAVVGGTCGGSLSGSIYKTNPITAPCTVTAGFISSGSALSAPTNVTATAGNARATVRFTAPASAGSPITGYTVISNSGGIRAQGTGSPITVTGLTNGTAYTFTVTARNETGTSPPSGPSNSVTPATVPDAPTNVTATAGNGQATVSFKLPANGGSPITRYTATSSPGGITASGAGSPITVHGLANGTTYTFSVDATNVMGTGALSHSVTATPATKPGAPTGVTAKAGYAQATITFMPPEDDGGSPITGYTLVWSPKGGKDIDAEKPPTIHTHTVTGLTEHTIYTFSVEATNVMGTGPQSHSIRVIPLWLW